ncbi:hypothetical protein IEQ34_005241 [Dendrobium chrysotoxum]|uniref:Uncharacterized protein n=1 Tax=Dendrobium chrysotoxum TaxID=161865 RepID=A0AAV7HCF9_DENCH|nr:hypothetical protein IEQ34_005241 [Dendrobium chrysotoxum]
MRCRAKWSKSNPGNQILDGGKVFNHQRISTMENQMESRFERLEEMMRKLIEMQSKTPLTVPIANPNQDLIRIPLVESKGKKSGQEFNEESFSSKTTS